jgi:hypothetical protein
MRLVDAKTKRVYSKLPKRSAKKDHQLIDFDALNEHTVSQSGSISPSCHISLASIGVESAKKRRKGMDPLDSPEDELRSHTHELHHIHDTIEHHSSSHESPGHDESSQHHNGLSQVEELHHKLDMLISSHKKLEQEVSTLRTQMISLENSNRTAHSLIDILQQNQQDELHLRHVDGDDDNEREREIARSIRS